MTDVSPDQYSIQVPHVPGVTHDSGTGEIKEGREQIQTGASTENSQPAKGDLRGNQTGNEVLGCIEKFPDWPPGAKTANGTALCH
jgi:hypothetical protein